MDAIVYRKLNAELAPATDPTSEQPEKAAMSVAAPEAQMLSAAHFYPLIREPEMTTWTHWLPTAHVFPRSRMGALSEITHVLSRLKAPAEVVEEFRWAWNMELFDVYEVRTPVRRDARDPVLIGRVGEERYRLAFWGESLLPLEQITELVQQSLAIKARATVLRTWLLLGSTVLGLTFGVWFGPLLLEANAVSAGMIFALLSFLLVWLPVSLRSPENRQHDFLDRYRC